MFSFPGGCKSMIQVQREAEKRGRTASDCEQETVSDEQVVDGGK